MKDTEGTENPEVGNIYISSEQIIQEVQKFRCLYDPADPDHKDRDVVRDAWLSVTQAVVGEPWNELNQAERNEAEKDIKRKWRFMRDGFVRSLKIENNPMPMPERNRKHPRVTQIRRTCRYIHYKAMSFLLETEHYKQFSQDHSSHFDDTDIPPEPSATAERPDVNPPSGTAVEPHPGPRLSQPLQKSTGTSNLTTQQDYASDSSTSCYPPYLVPHHSSNPVPEDPDRMFLLSLLPRVSALNSRDKMDFQIALMQVLQGYEEEDSIS